MAYTVTLNNVTGPDVVSLTDGTTYATLTVNANAIPPVVADTTPQLGGDLDLNSNDITGTGNINITGTLETSGNVTIGGDLTVNGTTTTINSTTLTVDDLNVVVASGAADAAAANGAGLTVDGANATLTYVSAGDNWAFNKGLTAPSATLTTVDINGGTIDGTVIGGSTPAAITGTTITGTSFVSSGNMTFGDNDKAIFGAGSDLQIYHDASSGYSQILESGPAGLLLRSNDLRLQSSTGENGLIVTENGAVTVYYDNAAKLATTATGIDVTGTVTADGLTVDGDVEVNGTGDVNGAVLIVDDAGSLGIEIQSNTPTILFKEDDTTNENYQIRLSSGDLNFQTQNDARNSAATKMTLDASGNLGIGTSSPDNLLTIQTGTYANAYVPISNLRYNANDVLKFGFTGAGGSIRTGTIDTGTYGFAVNTGGGTERMRITSTGSVGIGTSSPAARLEVALGAEGEYMRVGGDNATNGRALRFTSSTSSGSNGALHTINASSSQGAIALATNSTERMRITSTGNVGIGTSSPAKKLQVVGSSGDTALFGGVNNGSGTKNIGGVQLGCSTDNGDRRVWGIKSESTNPGMLGFWVSSNNASEAFSGTQVVSISRLGNVGIGTSNPSATLDVQSSDTIVSEFNGTNASNTAEIIIRSNGGVGNNTRGRIIGGYEAGGSSYGGFLAFNTTTTSNVNTERMRIDSSGNVGIGTSSPSSFQAGAENLVVGSGSLDEGITIYSGSANRGNIYFADGTTGTDLYRGQINYFHDSDYLRFVTAATEKMRIDASGNLLVGTTNATLTAPGCRLNASGRLSAVADNPSVFGRDASNGAVLYFYATGASLVGSISVGASSTTYNTSSDYRLKEDVQPMVGASDRVLALNPVNFAWKVDGTRTDGFIAHEAQAIAPYAVTGEKDGEEMQGMDHSKLVPLLTAALQEALQKIEALEARITALEAQL